MDTKQLSVADVMTMDPIVIRVDASLEEVDRLLRSTFITGIPVVDADGALVGIIGHAHLAAYRFARPEPPSDETGWAPRRRADEFAQQSRSR